MNLGQLIDPEWVQQERPDRFPARRSPAVAPLVVRTISADKRETVGAPEQASSREFFDAEDPVSIPEPLLARRPAAEALPEDMQPKQGRGTTRAILKLLGTLNAEASGLGAGDIYRCLGSAKPSQLSSVSALLSGLESRGDVAKSGMAGSYRFKLTERGRARARR